MSILVTDAQDGLTVYHYSDDTPTDDLDKLNIRGIVKDGEQVIVKTFGYTPEVVATNNEQLNTLISPLVRGPETKFYKSYEGTLLRVWWWKDKWYLTTHRKLDAFKSKWGSKHSYGDLFVRALKDSFESFTSKLDTNKIYVFLLRSFAENRKVCDGAEEPTIYSVGAFIRDQEFAFTQDTTETGCASPEQLTTIDGPDALIDTVLSLNPREYQGIVILNPDGTSGKIVSPAYDELDKLRGNVPNVLHRYVQIRWNPSQQVKFRELYPEFAGKFDDWEQVMSDIVNNVYTKYVDRYVHHQPNTYVPDDQFYLMQQLHEYYHTRLRRHGERVTISDVWQILGTWQERDVNTLFKMYLGRRRKYGDGNNEPRRELRGGGGRVRTQTNSHEDF